MSGTIIHRTTSGGNVVEKRSTIEKNDGPVTSGKTIGDIDGDGDGVIVYIDNTPGSEFYLIEKNRDKWLLYCKSMTDIHPENIELNQKYHIKQWAVNLINSNPEFYNVVAVKYMFEQSENELSNEVIYYILPYNNKIKKLINKYYGIYLLYQFIYKKTERH